MPHQSPTPQSFNLKTGEKLIKHEIQTDLIIICLVILCLLVISAQVCQISNSSIMWWMTPKKVKMSSCVGIVVLLS